MIFHNTYNSWLTPGGYVDGDNNLLHVALKKVEEEIGQYATILDKDIFQLSISPIVGHMKREKCFSIYVYCLLEMDILINNKVNYL